MSKGKKIYPLKKKVQHTFLAHLKYKIGGFFTAAFIQQPGDQPQPLSGEYSRTRWQAVQPFTLGFVNTLVPLAKALKQVNLEL